MSIPIYLASILLEPERWKSREPTLRVSQWIDAVQEAGFAGIELWENHYALAAHSEQNALQQSNAALSIFNTYLLPEQGTEESWAAVSELCGRLGVNGLKFNLGKDPKREREYAEVLGSVAEMFPSDVRLLCECHPGTIVETPEAAARFFRRPGLQRVRVIVHPFMIGTEKLKRWSDNLGSKIDHLHTQMRDEEGTMLPLDSRPEYVHRQIEVLVDRGFEGTASVEFVSGTNTENDIPPRLFSAAKLDLECLKEHFLEVREP